MDENSNENLNSELMNIGGTPELTLDPIMNEPTQPEVIKASIIDSNTPKAPELDDSLSAEERSQVDAFAKQIDITNSNQILQYGAGAQKKMADFSESALEKVRTQDLGEAGKLISDVVIELKGMDAEEDKGLLGFFKRKSNKLTAMKAKYDKAEVNINKIVKALEVHQVTMMKDVAMMDKLYDLNLTYFKELTMYLLAGRQRLAHASNVELKQLVDRANQTGRTEDAEAVQKMEASINRFEKKLTDLDLTRTIAMQMAPQIRLVQTNEMLMAEKIQTILTNTIPLWKSQMVLALGMANNEAALRAQNAVTDMTNELLKKNAEKLRQSTTEVAKASERGVVDIETLRATNENLIQTFDEVIQIQAEGRQKRAEAEVEMRKMEAELKQKLMQISNKQ